MYIILSLTNTLNVTVDNLILKIFIINISNQTICMYFLKMFKYEI